MPFLRSSPVAQPPHNDAALHDPGCPRRYRPGRSPGLADLFPALSAVRGSGAVMGSRYAPLDVRLGKARPWTDT